MMVLLTNEDKNFNKNIKIRKRLECVQNDARISVTKNEMISLFSNQQDGAPAHRSCHTVAYLRSHVPKN